MPNRLPPHRRDAHPTSWEHSAHLVVPQPVPSRPPETAPQAPQHVLELPGILRRRPFLVQALAGCRVPLPLPLLADQVRLRQFRVEGGDGPLLPRPKGAPPAYELDARPPCCPGASPARLPLRRLAQHALPSAAGKLPPPCPAAHQVPSIIKAVVLVVADADACPLLVTATKCGRVVRMEIGRHCDCKGELAHQSGAERMHSSCYPSQWAMINSRVQEHLHV